jgi:hypothetical protein
LFLSPNAADILLENPSKRYYFGGVGTMLWTALLTWGMAQIEPPPPADWQPGAGQTFTRREVFLEARSGTLPGQSPVLTRTDRIVLGVKGNGNDMSWWRNTHLKLQPNQTYAVRFWLKGTGSGACAITGTNTVNRDMLPSADWTRQRVHLSHPCRHARHLPALRAVALERRGAVRPHPAHPVQVVHAALGEGEQIRNGRYQFASRYEGALSNAQAPLQRFDALFNTNRWVITPNREVVYRHSAAPYKMREATLWLNVPLEQDGSLTVMAQREGETSWRTVGQIRGRGEHRLLLPAELFPTQSLLIRLVGTGNGTIQVSHYRLEAALEGAERAIVIGKSLVLFPRVSHRSLEVSALHLEQDSNGNWQLRGNFSWKGDTAMRLVPFVGQKREKPLNLESGKKTGFRFPLPPPRLEETPVELGLKTEAGTTLWSVTLTLPVSILDAADYGYRVAGTPASLGIWWCEWGWKVGRDRPLPRATSRAVRVSAARGEYEPVQIVLRPQHETILQRVEISDLTRGKHRLPAQHLSLREVAYVWVEHPTDGLGAPGEYPDPLPPLKTPLRLQAGRNQPLWLTVYVPYGTAAGDYRGTLRIITNRGVAQIPLIVTVYDFDLPARPRSAAGSASMRIASSSITGRATKPRSGRCGTSICATFASIVSPPIASMPTTPTRCVSKGRARIGRSSWISLASIRQPAAIWTSSALMPLCCPFTACPAGRHPHYSPGEFGGFREGTPEYERLWRDYMRQLEAHLRERGWLHKAYIYWFDEPEEADYAFVRRVNERLKQAAPGLTRMLTEQPEEPLIGAVDLWCPLTAFVPPESIRARRQAGEEVWWYVCTGPRAPYATLFIDHPGTEMRLWLWQTWQYGVQGILIWQTTWWHNEFAYPDRLQNPWDDPMSYVWDASLKPGTRLFWGNGDGRLLYPPRRDPNTATEPIIEEPIPSIRWECLRDGAEDYEYFVLLQRLCEQRERQGNRSRAT